MGKIENQLTKSDHDHLQKSACIIKRDIIKGIEPSEDKGRISLFGSVKGGNITEEMIDEAKRSLFSRYYHKG